VRLAVYDVRGALVAILVDRVEGAGTKSVSWGGRSGAGVTVPAGVYVIRLQSGDAIQTRKIVRGQ
jgi:hypothetical protein